MNKERKLTKAQSNELEVWEYFIPQNVQWFPKTDKDIEMFFEWSERGKYKDIAELKQYLPEGRTYFHALIWGKKYAGMHVHELWEKDFFTDSWMGYYQLLGRWQGKKRNWFLRLLGYEPYRHKPIPRPVVDYIKKEMFKGVDAEVIEKCYQEIL